MAQDNELEMSGICKFFPGVQALKDVDFACRGGEVHALVGENGAGKSTLVKILAGDYEADEGEIKIKGEQVEIRNPGDALSMGVSIIYQEFNLLPYMSIAENITLGRAPRSAWGTVDWATMRKQAESALARIGVEMDVREKVRNLSVAEQQLVEIAKALLMDAQIMVMDEPSAVLAGHELETLFNIIRSLKEQGVTIIYISHRLDEVFEIADRATVLKDGQYVGTVDIASATKSQLIRMMVGRTLDETYPPIQGEIGEVILRVEGLNSGRSIQNVSFELHEGEVLGLAGLVGAGRTEVARAIFGVDHMDSGRIYMDSTEIRVSDPKRAVSLGMGMVPEDRKQHGFIPVMSVAKNITLPILDRLQRFGIIQQDKEDEIVEDYIDDLDIMVSGPDQEIQYLSGGNQQKVILAKWLSAQPKVIILDEPTRGVDVGTKAEIYHLIRELAGRGVGIIFISSELPEILGLSDRILVMYAGRIQGELSRDEATEERILTLATGATLEGEPAAT
jgi:ABC-type sugar transport system ATPase subunit